MSEYKAVVYAYVNPKNKEYIASISQKLGVSISICVDSILDAARLKREIKLPNKKLLKKD